MQGEERRKGHTQGETAGGHGEGKRGEGLQSWSVWLFCAGEPLGTFRSVSGQSFVQTDFLSAVNKDGGADVDGVCPGYSLLSGKTS